MPISPKLTSMIDRALSNRILSNKEVTRIVTEAEKDGVSPDEVNHIVGALAEAMQDGLELDTTNRKKRVNNLLAKLETHHPLGLDESAIERAGPGTVSYLDALLAKGGTASLPPVDVTPAPVDVTPAPVDVTPAPAPRFSVDLQAPSDASQKAALARVVGGELMALAPADKAAATVAMLDGLEAGLSSDGADPQAFLKHTTATATLGGLFALGADLSTNDADRLLALYAKAPAPMAQALIIGALDKAAASGTLGAAQTAARAALEAPEHQDALLKTWSDVVEGKGKIGSAKVEGDLAALVLSGLAYCKKPASVESLFAGIGTFKDLNPGGNWNTPFDAEEVSTLRGLLSSYTQGHEKLAYVFGSWKNDAPKHKAKITQSRIAPTLLAQLAETPPRIGDVPLAPEQVQLVKAMVAGVKDERAMRQLTSALKEAAFITSPNERGWSGLPTPDAPMAPTAQAFLARFAQRFVDEQGGTPDGMIDFGAMTAALKKEGESIREEMQPRLAELGLTPAQYNGITMGPEAASTLRTLLTDHTRSGAGVNNIGLAVKLVAQKHGGGLATPAASAMLNDIVVDYMANWPNYTVFDFNKLERIAKFKVEGKELPLCSINGVPANLAQFYTKVAETVTAAVDRTGLRHEWMAHRYGHRAKESVELLDVTAEKTSLGEGPIVALQQQFPGKTVSVQATGLDGAHQQFLFVVKDGERTLGVYNQGSDGNIKRYTDSRAEPVLFHAAVNDDGSFDVRIDDPIKTRRYPLQTTYGVGDSIDIEVKDPTATEVRTEGETFDTKAKIVQAKITGFGTDGRYTLSYQKPDGTDATKTMSLDRIRKTNHPHYFSETGSYIRDMEINLTKDADLKSFLDDAMPIIHRHLPTDGSMASMAPREVARRQKACIDDLMKYADEGMKYPNMTAGNEKDERYRELNDLHRFPLGELLKIGKGQCRHQCIISHLLFQRAGIDSRLASGSANTSSGNYRGLHLWIEVSLANDARYLSDQTWKDEAIPLWNGAYDVDKRRVEIANRTSDFDRNQAA